MSLPIYEAVGFQKILDKGGHSKPWLVLVDMKGSPRPYVVKLYKTIDIEARNKMTAEVLGNALAPEFGLNVPAAAIVNFSEDFRMHLNAECEELLSALDDRPKFGTEFIEGANLYNVGFTRKETQDVIDPSALYAFDYFICNRDRNLQKPNLLIKQEQSYLIDHEMALEIGENTFRNFEQEQWDTRYQHHLFHHFITKYKEKSNLFDEFLFYLESINFRILDSYFNQLEELGFETNKEKILNYWQSVQKKSSIFANILLSSIQ
jgi:predicted Ser/Thr protein kinase